VEIWTTNNQKPPWWRLQTVGIVAAAVETEQRKITGNLKKEQPKTTVVRASRRGLGGYRSEPRAMPWVSPGGGCFRGDLNNEQPPEIWRKNNQKPPWSVLHGVASVVTDLSREPRRGSLLVVAGGFRWRPAAEKRKKLLICFFFFSAGGSSIFVSAAAEKTKRA
jgi:hypothetical protein